MTLPKYPSRIHVAALLVALLVVAVDLFFWLTLRHSQEMLREQTIANAEHQALKLASALGKQAEAQASGLDVILRHLRNEYQVDQQPAHLKRQMALMNLPTGLAIQLSVIGADGYLVYSSLAQGSRVYLGEREHFRAFADDPSDRLLISKPVLGKVSHVWSVQFVRPLQVHGRFFGVMVMSIAARHLALQLADLQLASNDVAALVGSDGFYRARSTHLAEVMGQLVPAGAPFLKTGAPMRGVFRLISRVDGVERLYAWRRLDNYPLVVVVGLDMAQILAPAASASEAGRWRSWMAIASVLLLGGGIVWLLIRLATQQRRLQQSEQLYHGLFEAVAEGLLVVAPDGRVVAWNQALLTLLGLGEAEVRAQQFQFLSQDGKLLPRGLYPTDRALHGECFDYEVLGIVRGGKTIWLAASGRPLYRAGEGRPYEAVLSLSDVTEVVESQQTLRLAQSVFEVANEGIMVTDADNRIIAVNPAFTAITGYTAQEVIGRHPSLLASGLHDQAFYAGLWHRLLADGHWEGELRNRRKNGSLYTEWLKITVLNDELGAPRRFVALLSDITEQKLQEEHVWRQANFDMLTGLPNRKLLEDRLQLAQAQAQRKGSQVAVLFLDLNRFKPVNDRFGHAAGDALLCQVARRLEGLLRGEDTVARVGGDEFVVVLSDLHSLDSAEVIRAKIAAALQQPFDLGAQVVEISCSIGMAFYPRDSVEAAQLIHLADMAMYRAKHANRPQPHKGAQP